jgi:hypothetical protein
MTRLHMTAETGIIIADASRVTGADFLRALQGKPPLTQAEKAEREADNRRRMAELEQQHGIEMMELRRRILAQFKTEEGRAAMLAAWAAEGVDCAALTEVHGDPMKRRAA